MEDVEVLEPLTGGGEHDRLADDPGDGQGGTATGVAVELGEDDPVEADSLLEGHCGVDRVLTDHGVDDEQRLVRVSGRLDVGSLGHHLGIDTQASGGVDDDDVIELALGLDDGVTSHLDGITNTVAGLRSEDMHTGSLTDDLQLGDRVGTLQVTGGQQRRVPLLLEPPSELARQGRLTGTLKSSEHDDGGRGLREPDGAGLTAKDLDELLVDDLDDLLSRVERLRQFLAVTAFLDRRNEFLDDRQVDVGLEEGDADLASRGVDVGIGETSLATQSFEGGCEAVLESVEHGCPSAH